VVFSVFQLSSSASPNILIILGWVSLFLWFQVQSDFCYCNHLFGCLCQPDVTVFDAVSIMLNTVPFFLCVCIVHVQFTFRQ
jgi:hypothetical protein